MSQDVLACRRDGKKSFGTVEGIEELAARHKGLLLVGLSCHALTGREACVSCAMEVVIITMLEHPVLS